MKALLVAPVFDEVTPYSYDWSREVKNILESKGYEVKDLSGKEISRKDVEKHLDDIDLFCFYDHGSENALWGSREEPIIDLSNVKLLSGKEVFTMACLSAKKLGVEAWKSKSKVYWGYYEVFSFTTDSLEEFKKFANCGIKFRLEGKSWKECLSLAKDLGNKLAEELSKAGKFIAASCMRHDVNALRCYNAEAPATKCIFRKIALKILGKIGWFITRLRGLSILLFGIGFGVALHDFAHSLWEVGGYREVLSPQGGYFGFALMLLAFILEFGDFIRLVKKRFCED